MGRLLELPSVKVFAPMTESEYQAWIYDLIVGINLFGGFLDEERLCEMSINPDDESILWMPEHGMPEFLVRDGKIPTIIREIHATLQPQFNPLGIMDWWTRLSFMTGREAPVSVLGTDQEYLLARAATLAKARVVPII